MPIVRQLAEHDACGGLWHGGRENGCLDRNREHGGYDGGQHQLSPDLASCQRLFLQLQPDRLIFRALLAEGEELPVRGCSNL